MNNKADTIITNGKVYSILLDGKEITGESIAISDGKILAVGSDTEIGQYADNDTVIIDAKGNSVLPAFCDAHVHSSFTGSTLFACDLFDIKKKGFKGNTLQQYQAALKQYIDENPDLKVIKGCGWDFMHFTKKLPDRHMLDEVCSDKPIFLESYCQHHLWINSKALEMTGFTSETPDPRNGLIERDENGNPSGHIAEFTAINLVKERVPETDYSVEEYKKIIKRYQSEFGNSYGVTMIFDACSTPNAKIAFEELAQDGELTIRIRDNYCADPSRPMSQFDDMIANKGKHDVGDMYVRNVVKFYMESAAPDMCFIEPYKWLACKMFKKPNGYKGYLYWTDEELKEIMPKLLDAGFQLHAHAMGDASVKQTVDAYEYAQKKTGKENRNTIAHLMAVKPEDIKRMGDNNIIACMQMAWMAMNKAEIRLESAMLGKKRVLDFYPYKRFLDSGAIVSSGTDFPVTPPPDPFMDMAHAITRKPCPTSTMYEKSAPILGPKANPTVDVVGIKDVIKSRTIAGAYQCYSEDITGSLEEGKSADIIILDRNLFDTPIDEIYATKVEKTIFKGETVYERS